MTIEEYLKLILAPLVTYADDLVITRFEDEQGLLVTIGANDKDMPVIIGKAGRFAQALRVVARTFCSRDKIVCHLRVQNKRIE